MINYNLEKVYDWYDIQDRLTELLGVEDFRGNVGTNGVDYWNLALATIIPEKMSNDSIVEMYDYEIKPVMYVNHDYAYMIETEEELNSAEKLVTAWNTVLDELGSNNILVRFRW